MVLFVVFGRTPRSCLKTLKCYILKGAPKKKKKPNAFSEFEFTDQSRDALLVLRWK